MQLQKKGSILSKSVFQAYKLMVFEEVFKIFPFNISNEFNYLKILVLNTGCDLSMIYKVLNKLNKPKKSASFPNNYPNNY